MNKGGSGKMKEFEMVNLQANKRKAAENYIMKQFEPAGKVNQTAKKREKRKLKKQKEQEIKAEQERQQKLLEEERAK